MKLPVQPFRTHCVSGTKPIAMGSTHSMFASHARPVRQITMAEDVDFVLKDLQVNCNSWQAMPNKKKVAILKNVRARALKASAKLGKATAKTTGFCSQGHPDVIHDDVANLTALFVGPTVAKTATSYINQLTQIESQGKMEPVKCLRKTADGRSVIDRGEWPNKSDIVMKGARTHVYTQTGAELSQGVEAAAVSGAHRIGAAVVLGAGNQPFLSIEDTLHMLFDRNLPVLLKHHPAQAMVAPFWEYVLEPLAEAGVYKGVFADIPMTRAAVYSERTAAVHLTGSLQTHDAILYGSGKEGEKGKAENAPLLSVPFTSELGNVTPVFITPAKWTQEEMVKAAQTIAFGTTLNAGCNCLSPKVIVMSDQWPQADAFEAVLKAHFNTASASPCWYPGSKDRYNDFLDAHPNSDLVQSTIPANLTYSAEILPWAFDSVTLTSEEEAASVQGIKEEFFAPVLVVLRIPGNKAATESGEAPSTTIMQHSEDFLQRIPMFADKYLLGNLVCSLYLPASVKAEMPKVVENCIDNLRYGSVIVNSAPLTAYTNHLGAWGGHMSPETSVGNVGSGFGKIHNFAQIDNVEKQVCEFPWGSTIDFTDTPKIPGFLVKFLAGKTGDGWRGVWNAITP